LTAYAILGRAAGGRPPVRAVRKQRARADGKPGPQTNCAYEMVKGFAARNVCSWQPSSSTLPSGSWIAHRPRSLCAWW